MKFVRWGLPGAERAGVLDEDGRIRDLSSIVADVDGTALEKLSGLTTVGALPLVPGTPRLGPCITGVGKVICIGLNYADHAAESGVAIPTEPIVFFKAPSAIAGPNDDLVLPRGSHKVDWEVELCLVIGRRVAYADEAMARSAIAAYCLINDISERAWQLERGGQWVKGKSADGFAPLGPWLVTADGIENPSALHLWLEVDGHRYQDSTTAQMIFKPYFLVSYLSQFMSLQPGDIIATGTPRGVGLGRKPPTFLRPGQTIHLGIDGLGTQTQRVVAG